MFAQFSFEENIMGHVCGVGEGGGEMLKGHVQLQQITPKLPFENNEFSNPLSLGYQEVCKLSQS